MDQIAADRVSNTVTHLVYSHYHADHAGIFWRQWLTCRGAARGYGIPAAGEAWLHLLGACGLNC